MIPRPIGQAMKRDKQKETPKVNQPRAYPGEWTLESDMFSKEKASEWEVGVNKWQLLVKEEQGNPHGHAQSRSHT